MKDLEREKDFLWIGLQALEQVREKLCYNLEDNMEVQDQFKKGEMRKVFFFFFVSTCLYLLVFNIFSIHQVFLDTPTLLLAQIHRVNRTLRSLLCDSRNPIEGHYFNNVHQIPVKTFSSLFIVTFMCQNYSVQCIESSLLFVRY